MPMVGEGTTAIFITFVFAIIGYVGLTTVMVSTLRGKFPIWLWRGIALVIIVHVLMVWTYRYSWHFELAVRNGYAGFLIFHSAVLIIVASTVARREMAQYMIHAAFLVVSAGALGASFRYEVVELYRIPVVLCALTGGFMLIRHYGPILMKKKAA